MAHVVGLGRPLRLALGAATGTPAAEITACATGCAGTRSATVDSPARTAGGTQAGAGTTTVNGPGANASTAARAAARREESPEADRPGMPGER